MTPQETAAAARQHLTHDNEDEGHIGSNLPAALHRLIRDTRRAQWSSCDGLIYGQ